MNKVTMAKRIAKSYFILALVVSFLHLVHAGFKGGLTWESYLIPFMVDGIAMMGMLLRGEEFSSRTRKIGFRTQIIAGVLSLAGNVYAAHNVAGIVMGTAVVSLFIFAEWLTDQIESVEVETARKVAEEAAAKKAEAIAKAAATRKRNARTKKAEVKVLESMLTK